MLKRCGMMSLQKSGHFCFVTAVCCFGSMRHGLRSSPNKDFSDVSLHIILNLIYILLVESTSLFLRKCWCEICRSDDRGRWLRTSHRDEWALDCHRRPLVCRYWPLFTGLMDYLEKRFKIVRRSVCNLHRSLGRTMLRYAVAFILIAPALRCGLKTCAAPK